MYIDGNCFYQFWYALILYRVEIAEIKYCMYIKIDEQSTEGERFLFYKFESNQLKEIAENLNFRTCKYSG